jgi:hypothetical protein
MFGTRSFAVANSTERSLTPIASNTLFEIVNQGFQHSLQLKQGSRAGTSARYRPDTSFLFRDYRSATALFHS